MNLIRPCDERRESLEAFLYVLGFPYIVKSENQCFEGLRLGVVLYIRSIQFGSSRVDLLIKISVSVSSKLKETIKDLTICSLGH